MLHSAKYRAKKKGVPFTIAIEDVSIPAVCPVLGIPLVVATGTRVPRDDSPTLDRIDNSAGYIPGNVLVVSWKANRIKNNATVEELRRIADFYEERTAW